MSDFLWRRARFERKRRWEADSHQFYVSRYKANATIELTCRRCGYKTTNLDPRSSAINFWPAESVSLQRCPG